MLREDLSRNFGFLLNDVARLLRTVYDRRIRELGLTRAQWWVLTHLFRADGITQTELSALAGVKNPTTFAALQSMEREGFITRRKRPGNLKNKYVYLTPRGRALKHKLLPLAEEVHRVAIRSVSARNVEITRTTLIAMIGNLDRDAALF